MDGRVTTERDPAASGRRRKRSRGELKEQAILDAAWELICTRPVSEITIDDLAAAAGITRSNFYVYFESKTAALKATASRFTDQSRARIADLFAVDPADITFELIQSVMRIYLDDWQVHGHAYQAMYVLGADDAALRAFWDQFTNALIGDVADVVDRLRAAGLALPGPPTSHDLVAAIFFMMSRAGLLSVLDGKSAEELDVLAETLAAIAWRSIRGVAPPGP